MAPSSEAGILVRTISTAASTATFGRSTPSAREADRVLANVALLVGVWRDIQSDIADDEAAGVGWRGNHRAVADQSSGAKFCFLLHDRVQEHVAMQTTLHQRRKLPRARSHGGLERGVLGAVRGLDPKPVDVQARGFRDLADFGVWTKEHVQN
jgi:hypothetical protein